MVVFVCVWLLGYCACFHACVVVVVNVLLFDCCLIVLVRAHVLTLAGAASGHTWRLSLWLFERLIASP